MIDIMILTPEGFCGLFLKDLGEHTSELTNRDMWNA
jgi:hypothetical protein